MLEVFNHTLMITGFVFVMMLLIEYLNVLTSGIWQQWLAGRRWGQYLLAALLGAVPGCLGAFVVVAMYSHRTLTLGAVVAAMIATSGDEAFVMLALIPRQGLVLMVVLFAIGIAAGAVTDILFQRQKIMPVDDCAGFQLHGAEVCRCFSHGRILQQWKELSAVRGILLSTLGIFIFGLVSGQVGPPEWNWIRITILGAASFALFFVATVPEHFLEEHLWKHLARQHLPRIFLWTFGTLLVMHLLTDYLHLEGMIQESPRLMLMFAGLIGLIPESGPHLIFVTLYAQGTVPFSILLASSIVQDGHGMLPLLAHSRKAFVVIKLVNLLVGWAVGAVVMGMGL
ncbi:MAG: arsenic efflux protein [Calditrichaeota bacterium]|nr:arsenic efflux protein [Calditrichota bacterium]MCB0313948.1 arsenic efflux protein [Calditrichota bacterium]